MMVEKRNDFFLVRFALLLKDNDDFIEVEKKNDTRASLVEIGDP